MNYLIALNLIDKNGEYLKDTFKNSIEIKSQNFQQAYFSLTSNVLNMDPPLNQIYEKENIKENSGIKELLFDTKQLVIFYNNNKLIFDSFTNNKFKKIWSLCSNLLKEYKIVNKSKFLKKAIVEFDLNYINKTNTIAVVYFTYQLLLPVF